MCTSRDVRDYDLKTRSGLTAFYMDFTLVCKGLYGKIVRVAVRSTLNL